MNLALHVNPSRKAFGCQRGELIAAVFSDLVGIDFAENKPD
jgi:hypothetical protein